MTSMIWKIIILKSQKSDSHNFEIWKIKQCSKNYNSKTYGDRVSKFNSIPIPEFDFNFEYFYFNVNWKWVLSNVHTVCVYSGRYAYRPNVRRHYLHCWNLLLLLPVVSPYRLRLFIFEAAQAILSPLQIFWSVRF